jgi:hypothetical protein
MAALADTALRGPADGWLPDAIAAVREANSPNAVPADKAHSPAVEMPAATNVLPPGSRRKQTFSRLR